MHTLFYILLLVVLYNNYVIFKYTNHNEPMCEIIPTSFQISTNSSLVCRDDLDCPIRQDLYRRNIYSDTYVCFEGLCVDLDEYRIDFLASNENEHE